MAKHVPALKEKFRFLIECGYIGNLYAIALHFGKSLSTIQWWEHGDDARTPNSISNTSEEALFDLVASCLPKPQSDVFVRRLTYGPLAEFKRAFEVLSSITLDDLIVAEGLHDGIRIVEKGKAGLFEFDDDHTNQGTHQIPANAYFRLELDCTFERPHVAALRFQNNSWIPLPVALDHSATRILVPGRSPEGQPRFMRETEAHQTMRVIIMQATSMIPEAVHIALRHRTALDLNGLSSVASAFEREQKQRKALHVIDLKTVTPY